MSATTLDGSARAAVASACPVDDAAAADHVDGVAAGLVARPTSTEQVAEVLRASAAHGLTVVPRGRGTKLTWGRPPVGADLLLDLDALDRVLDHAAGDLIVHAQAGARLADVQAAVAGAGQRLAVDETVPGASVGGTLATGASGPLRVSAGTMRDLLIGLTVVRADGVVAKAGGRVVKNVAGYDLGKLLHGSFGTLAVVTEALFRLHPLRPARRWVTVPVAGPADAHRATQAAVHSQAVPVAVEVHWPGTGSGTVAVLVEGTADGVAGRAATLRRLLGEAAADQEQQPDWWGRYPWDPAAAGDQRATALKLTFALSGLADVLAATRDAGPPVTLAGSSGAGVVYAAMAPDSDVPAVAAAVERLRTACTRHGGSAVVLDGPAAVKAAVDTWGPVPALDLMRRVKDQFDPDHRLAPGRFVGGI
ncbi:MAG: FAD-binding oxidoreductase [Nocardioidaceae bacterium]